MLIRNSSFYDIFFIAFYLLALGMVVVKFCIVLHVYEFIMCTFFLKIRILGGGDLARNIGKCTLTRHR
jgi:hypothetical protein